MNPTYKSTINLPVHARFFEFLQSLFPPHPRDVPLIYHEPRERRRRYDPENAVVREVVLSITPTRGVYSRLEKLVYSPNCIYDHRTLSSKPVCFLHRPFDLDRRAVPPGVVVTASHKRFDELWTVGWNVALAAKLGLNVGTAVCIQGYKGDPERRIGLVGQLSSTGSVQAVQQLVLDEFGVGDIYPKHDPETGSVETQVDAIAIMNAFGPDEIARAVDAAVQAGFITEGNHERLLYLTGEPKEMGLAAMKEKFNGMFAVCVGHRPAEEWGIRWLGACIKEEWKDVTVHMVFEDEEKRIPPAQNKGDKVAPIASSGIVKGEEVSS